MEIAKHDISYCVNEKCKECCWRNITHWCFEDEYYSFFMGKCEKV